MTDKPPDQPRATGRGWAAGQVGSRVGRGRVAGLVAGGSRVVRGRVVGRVAGRVVAGESRAGRAAGRGGGPRGGDGHGGGGGDDATKTTRINNPVAPCFSHAPRDGVGPFGPFALTSSSTRTTSWTTALQGANQFAPDFQGLRMDKRNLTEPN